MNMASYWDSLINIQYILGGFVPGETIVFSATIDNRSKREINALNVKLLEKLTFSGKESGNFLNILDCLNWFQNAKQNLLLLFQTR